ncbi:MAG: SIS domain-containing protein [Desulfococcaceae bacterium]
MIQEQAKEVLRTEAQGILHLIEHIDDRFRQMAELICHSTGRLIVAGIGKSGIIGRKFVATFNSTGTRSFFLHPVEAMHGDLGMVCPDDILLALSNSGETDELNIMIPSIRSIGCKIIAFTGKPDSTLGRNSDIVINVGVEKEACPMGLAPTASTTALLAMGDALAVVLINCKNFKSGDFRKIHPGGALGQRLSKKVEDFMLTGDMVPLVYEDTSMPETLAVMDRISLGVALVVKPDRTLSGIITDGDIRRMLAKQISFSEKKAGAVMTVKPKSVSPQTPAYDALNIMESFEITVLPVCSSGGVVLGILHLHDILGKGEFKFNGT